MQRNNRKHSETRRGRSRLDGVSFSGSASERGQLAFDLLAESLGNRCLEVTPQRIRVVLQRVVEAKQVEDRDVMLAAGITDYSATFPGVDWGDLRFAAPTLTFR